MPHIELLDQITIDKIAAGEVIERPASVVKELVENAVDAGADAIVVEIEEGGISLIRITDNGCGIKHEEAACAFLRHSTSKIRSEEDLIHVSSLGFRGEALSSIAAVSKVEMITKTQNDMAGTRYLIEGGKEKSIEEIGAPDGTTFLVRQLFYNTPARRKFLKTPTTEAGQVSDLMIRLSLSHPEISFQFINNRQVRLHTSGNGRLKDVIYHVYGRDVANNLILLSWEKNGLRLKGFLGKPVISRGNRNFENYFINGRYIRSQILSKAIEDAYKDFTMQHKYPFVAIHMEIDPERIDVNVHPAKMEMRFDKQQEIYDQVYTAVCNALHEQETIPEIKIPKPVVPLESARGPVNYQTTQTVREESAAYGVGEEKNLDYFMEKMKERVKNFHKNRVHSANKTQKTERAPQKTDSNLFLKKEENKKTERGLGNSPHFPQSNPQKSTETTQLNLFDEKILEKDIRQEYRIIGQVFDTYWLIQFQENLYIIDQHAAHERVLYERTLAQMKSRVYTSQYLNPPIILSLTMQEIDVIKSHMDSFTAIGFEIEPFGGDEYAVRAVPDNLFGIAKKDLLLEMLDALVGGLASSLSPEIIDEKIASMSCKAAVKGNSRLSVSEVDALIAELLTLENPYHCPHGRPTIISMTRRELEKKFKRIV
ncbi:MAG: DNA mismatch repair endonuclease MutL [Coprococcus sp.]|nr:DNA mismatch repair endonuclease MutL [Coprococcus sp.]